MLVYTPVKTKKQKNKNKKKTSLWTGINLGAEPGYKLVKSDKLDLNQLDAVPLIPIK